jgi:hypothetical protein
MAIQYTDPTTVTPPIKIATDVFNTPNIDVFLKPDATLANLEKQLRAAKTDAARKEITDKIQARQSEIAAEFGSVGFGSSGYVTPGNAYSESSGSQYSDLLAKQKATQAALAGKQQLMGGDGVYQAQYYGPQGQTGYVRDPETGELVDQYEYAQKVTLAQLAGKSPKGANLKVFYDENGKQLTPEQVAKSGVGASFAAAGWDIGFGAGNIGAGTPATTNLPFSGSASTTTLPFSGSASTVNLKTPAQIAAETKAAELQADRQSAYDLLYSQFKLYGLESLVEPLKGLITSGASPSEFTIKLRESDAYKKRFSANQARIQKGLKAISEAEYLGLEDQYQNIMRNYGLPAEYYARGDMGTQEGFNKFIANDVSAAELEDRVMTAQSRVLNANPEVLASLKAFYPDITNGDILAYTLNPDKALTDIKRKVTSAEIGGGAMQAGLGITGTRAEELTAAGITKAQAQQGFGTIAGGLQRGSQLASIYGENPYTQTTAEKEVFGLTGKTEAEKERKKLTGLEKATFSGQTGLTTGALARDRAGAY